MMHENTKSEICPDSEKLNKDVSCNYILSIQLSKDWFFYTILDTLSNKYIALSSYSLNPKKSRKSKSKPESLYIEKLDEIISQFKWLKSPFKKVNVLYKNMRSVIIPNLMFDKSRKEDYLYFTHRRRDNEKLYYDYISAINSYNLYALPDFLEDELVNIFTKPRILHYSTTLLMNIFSGLNRNISQMQVFVNVQFEQFDIIIIKSGELIYYNTFRIYSEEDLVFYFFWVLRQLDINHSAALVMLMGELEKNSLIYREISKYISNVSFVKRNEDFKYIDVFDNIPGHYFYNLLNASSCV